MKDGLPRKPSRGCCSSDVDERDRRLLSGEEEVLREEINIMSDVVHSMHGYELRNVYQDRLAKLLARRDKVLFSLQKLVGRSSMQDNERLEVLLEGEEGGEVEDLSVGGRGMTPNESLKRYGHPRTVPGFTLNELAQAISILRYDSLAELLHCLSLEVLVDSGEDKDRGRVKLSQRLDVIASHLEFASTASKHAWAVCKPFEEKKGARQ